MIYPTIHLGGTARADLLAQHLVAMLAVAAAIEALRLACPNGRDYYPQGADYINAAMDAHGKRLDALQAILADLEALAMHISDAP